MRLENGSNKILSFIKKESNQIEWKEYLIIIILILAMSFLYISISMEQGNWFNWIIYELVYG